MAYQFVLLAVLLVAAKASVVPGDTTILQAAPVVGAPIARTVVSEPYDPNPQYSFGYDVQDPLTGDSHGQVEARSGDIVKGSYNLLEADGTRRVVDYTSDPVNGFNAVVSKQGTPIVGAPAIARAGPIAVRTPLASPVPVLRSNVLPSAPLPPLVPRVLPSASPWLGAPVLRSALPAAPWQAPLVRSAPWQEPLVRSAPWQEPLVRSAPWQEPLVRSAPWQEPLVRSAPLW